MAKLLPHFLMLLAFLMQYFARTAPSGDIVSAIQSLESSVLFVGSVLSYLLLNTKQKGQNNG